MTVRDWLVSADDRTGAFEVAALLAGVDSPVRVDVGVMGEGSAVVDLGSRTMSPVAAAAAVESLPAARWRAHKIDSTLRGNWAAEVGALRGRVVVVPAWPAMGRTCVNGVVHVHGSALASVPDLLPGAVLLADAGALGTWLDDARGEAGVAVVDAESTAHVEAIAAVASGHDAVMVGPAGPIGAAFRAHVGASLESAAAPPVAAVAGPRLVVSASASAVAREQVARVRAQVRNVEVVESEMPDGPLHAAAARALAEQVRDRFTAASVVVLVGGDTAAAVLGDAPRWVGGFAAPGMPWSLDEHGDGPVVVTKAGAFGNADALVRLLNGETV